MNTAKFDRILHAARASYKRNYTLNTVVVVFFNKNSPIYKKFPFPRAAEPFPQSSYITWKKKMTHLIFKLSQCLTQTRQQTQSSAHTIELTWSDYVLIPTFENHHEGIAILNEQECDPPPRSVRRVAEDFPLLIVMHQLESHLHSYVAVITNSLDHQISWLLADIDAPVEDLRGLLAGIDAPVIQELEPYSRPYFGREFITNSLDHQISWLLADIDAPVEDLRGLLAGIDAPVIQELEPYSRYSSIDLSWLSPDVVNVSQPCVNYKFRNLLSNMEVGVLCKLLQFQLDHNTVALKTSTTPPTDNWKPLVYVVALLTMARVDVSSFPSISETCMVNWLKLIEASYQCTYRRSQQHC
ncbi:hypothetical protein DPMN_131592 [Dreissena polymorpha]|uniref:Uncharacterized protein n=1 Tax=Dreissena polymorpha TaxID=45954 RepID=A0A9D4FQ07_DREPO|nr:hypothetical protein DPMN_131592 [Dreissena polymorpha]